MADVVDRETRSRMMSGIRGRNTKPEILVRRGLFARGFRFRLHERSLPGRPDIVIRKHRLVILVHGCFWHGHEGCPYFRLPASNATFWRDKLLLNRRRDSINEAALLKQGWRVAVVWECALRAEPERCLDVLCKFVDGDHRKIDIARDPAREGNSIQAIPL